MFEFKVSSTATSAASTGSPPSGLRFTLIVVLGGALLALAWDVQNPIHRQLILSLAVITLALAAPLSADREQPLSKNPS